LLRQAAARAGAATRGDDEDGNPCHGPYA
jgi:hypothetical protein